MFDDLIMPPADKILSLMPIFRQDSRSNKIDLGVGVYRDASGTTPIPRAVREAEKRIHTAQTTKAYVGPAGDPVFAISSAGLSSARQRRGSEFAASRRRAEQAP